MISPYSWWCGVAAVALLLTTFALVVTPGAAIWSRIARWVDVPAPCSLLLALACSATLGYATFWVYLVHAGAGRIVSWMLLASTIGLLAVPRERRRLAAWLRDPDVALPALLLVGSAGFVLTWYLGFVPTPPRKNWSWVTHAYARLGMPDSSLPYVLAHKLYRGAPLHEGPFAAATIARTPLQAGMFLVQSPLWELLGRVRSDAVPIVYQTFGVLAQSFWVAAAWALARLLGIERVRAGWLVLALVPSHFFVLNVAYVWPKLLSASFVVGSYCLLLLRRSGAPPLSPGRALAAAALASLGVLAHPAVAPTLIGFGVILLVPRFFPGWRALLVAALVAITLVGPWVAYQQAHPMNFSLAKRFLGGVHPKDPRSLGDLVQKAWTGRPPAMVARAKWGELRRLAGFDPPATRNVWRRVRLACRETLGPSLGVLNVGWIVVLVGFVGWGPRLPSPLVRRTLGVALVCLALAIAVLFESGKLRHTSYATVTLLFVALGAVVTALPRWLMVTVLSMHVLSQLVVFSTQLEVPPFARALPTLTFAVALYAGLALLLVRAGRSSPD